jgi:hypothetical protein
MARRISWRPPCRRPRRRAGSIRLADGRIFDLDIHRIPASHHGLKHEHIDVRFLVEIDDWLPAPGNDESHQVRWMPLNQVLRFNNNRSTFRMPEMPEALDYTSFQARIRAYAEQRQPPSEREGSARLAGEARLCPQQYPRRPVLSLRGTGSVNRRPLYCLFVGVSASIRPWRGFRLPLPTGPAGLFGRTSVDLSPQRCRRS